MSLCTRRMRSLTRLAMVILLVIAPSSVLAQSTARVLKDQTPIWNAGFLTIATVVSTGTELEVVSRQGDWLEVRLPTFTQGTTDAKTGFVAVGQVELTTTGKEPADFRRAPGQAPTPDQRRAPARGRPAVRQSEYRAFGQLGYGRFAAERSFKAVFGDGDGVWFGAGYEFRSQLGFFVAGSFERFRREGERVFVTDSGDVFRLGIKETLSLTPLAITGGYHFSTGIVSPYIGGGIGRYFLSETSPIATGEENVKERFTSYHAVVGVEWMNSTHFGTAFEVQYTRVPRSLTGSVSGIFGENELGGIQTRIRLIFR